MSDARIRSGSRITAPHHGCKTWRGRLTLARAAVERPAGIEPVVIGLEDRSSAIELRTLKRPRRANTADPDLGRRQSPGAFIERATP